MLSRTFRSLFGGNKKKQPIRNAKKRENKVWLNVESLEDRLVPANFTPGNIAVLDLAAASSNTTGSIVELQPSGAGQTPVQTVSLASSGLRFSDSGTSSFLSDTNDRSLLTIAAYNTTDTTDADLANSPVSDRAVGTLDNSTSYTLQTTYSGTLGNQIRSATSIDNSHFYIADKGGLYSNGETVSTYPVNVGVARSFGGTVYVSSTRTVAQGNTADAAIWTVASPTATSVSALPGIAVDTSIADFYLIQSGSNGTTYDVLYKLDGSTITKYSLVSNSWTSNGTYTISGSAGLSLIAENDGSGGAYLFYTTGTSLVRVTDSAGYNSAISAGSSVTLYTATGSNFLKGLDFVPVTGLPSTTTALTATPASPEPALTSVTFTATVSPVTATGTVQFMDGSTALGSPVTLALVGGVPTATYTTSSLTVATHSITAVYSGDSSDAGSTSSALSYQITGAATTTTLTASPNPVVAGATETLTATESPVTATGTVQFMDGSTDLGTPVALTLVGGVPTAAYTTTTLSAGIHSITAVYSGDTQNAGSTSDPTSLEVDQAPAITSPSSATFGLNVAGTFNVTAAAYPTAITSYAETGTLPTGVTFDTSTGILSGTPSAIGSYPITLTATNSVGTGSAQNFTLNVTPAFAQWSFAAPVGTLDNNPAPTLGAGTATTLGMTNSYNSGSNAGADILSSSGVTNPNLVDNTWRVRGSSLGGSLGGNGWATAAAGAAQYTQGAEFDASTVGQTNVHLSFDWYSTTQGIRDLQVQYNSNINNSAGWTNYVAPGGTGSNGISTSGTYLATPNDFTNGFSENITVDLSGISAVNNDANFGIRLVSAFDSTGNVPNDYASAVLATNGTTQVYNNSSGNWRFDNITFSSEVSTTSAVTASPASPSQLGTNVTFTDTITPASGSNPTGTVQFYDGFTPIGSPVNVVAGIGNTAVATISDSALAIGTHVITAQYNLVPGDNFADDRSSMSYAVTGITTTSVVTASPASPQPVNTSITFTDNVTPSTGAGFPTGSVAFYDGTVQIGTTQTLTEVGGTNVSSASITLSSLASGSHNITAVYTPIGSFGGSTSSTLGDTVTNGTSGAFTPGNLVILQAGDGVNQYNAQAPLFLDEYTTAGAAVQQVAIPAVAGVGNPNNQPITIDLSAAPGNGQLTRSYDGSTLTFDGVASTINNGGLTFPDTPSGSDNRVIAVVTGDPTVASNINTTTAGPFYVGDDNRGSVAEGPTGPIYTAGHPNQAGGAVSQGAHVFNTEGPSIGTQVSATRNVRGITIGFDNRMYLSTAGGLGGTAALNTAGIFTEVQALPDGSLGTPVSDIQVVPAIFGASKLGGIFVADMNGDGIINNGDRIYFVDDGTVGGTGTGGLYVSTWNDAITSNPWNTNAPGLGGNNAAAVAAGIINHWSVPVRLGDAPVQPGSGNVGQLRGLTGTVISPTEADLYTTAYDNSANDNSYIQQWVDTGSGVSIANAQITTGTTVEITTLTANSLTTGQVVQVDGVGANNGPGAISSGYNGSWAVTVIDATHFTYTDTHSGASSLLPVNNQGAADVTLSGTIIDQLASGSDTITGQTYGDIGLRGVSFAPVAATNVTLSQSPANPLTPGTAVTLTATLSNAQVASLSGRVAFLDQNTGSVLGFGAISGNVATFTTTLVGNHYIRAYFGGGGPLALASANSNTIQVIEAGTTVSTTTLTSNLPAAAVARQVTLTATVTNTASGTVSFYNGSVSQGNLLGTSTIIGTTATLNTAFGIVGTQTVIAVYNGNDTFASSQGTTTVNVAVNAAAIITSSANNVAINSIQTYTATIVGNAILGTPTGSVVFTIRSATTGTNGNPLVTATSSAITLVAGANNTATALWTGPALTAPGSYFVTISYTASGATNPYSNLAINTTTATNGVALIETVKQAFTPGNLVAVQRGDGTVNLGSAGYLVFLDEYTPSGSLVQSIALPNTSSGSQNALLLSGQSGSEGLINRSANGYFLTLGGYDLPVGTTFVTSSFPFQYPRTIAEVNGSATVNTSTAISTTQVSVTAISESTSGAGTIVTVTTAPASGFTVGENVVITGVTPAGFNGQVTVASVSGTTFTYVAATAGLGTGTLSSAEATSASVPYNLQDVVSYDGNQFWLAGNLPVGDTTDNGIEYVSSVGATSATQIGSGNSSAAAISISGGQLYVTKGSGNIQAVGTGLPTTVGQSTSGLPNLANAYSTYFPNVENPEQILLLNTNDGTSNNPNVAYVADQANGLLKFYLNSASISTLTESTDGTDTVTVTTSAANGFTTGDQVQIAGASIAGYNGIFTITTTGANTFTYTLTTSGLANASGGIASEWLYGINGTGVFGEKLVFAGGATGLTGYVINPGTANAAIQLYVTGVNVTQQNPNQLDSYLDTNGAAPGSGSNGIDQGFGFNAATPNRNFTVLGFVGGASPAGSPNGNENFAGLAFVPGYITSTTLADTGPGASNTFTATVTSLGNNNATGVVIFSVDGTVVGQSTLIAAGSGAATATFVDGSFPTTGSHVITAAYQGDVRDGTSTATLTQGSSTITAGNLLVDLVGASAGVNGITESGTTATITTAAAHGFRVGQSVVIAGASVADYNASFTITAVPTLTTFTVTAAASLGTATGGTATLALGSSAAAASIVEYTTAGTAVQTISLPTTGAGAVTQNGSTATAGYITDSANGHTAVIAGYSAATGNSTSGSNGTIGVINPNGSVESSTQIPASTASSVRVAASADGLGFWVATSTGVQYVPFGNNGLTPSTQISNEVSSPNTVGIGSTNPDTNTPTPGQLFASAGAGSQSNGVPALDSPFTMGAGLPTVGGQSITVSPSFPTARDSAGNFPTTAQFAISPDGNTIYVADSRTDGHGGILKYFQATPNSWILISSLQLNSFAISSASETGTTVTITYTGGTGIASNDFPVGQRVEIDAVGTGFNGTFAIIPSTTSNTFTYTVTPTGLAAVTGAGLATSADGGIRGLVADFTGANPVLYATTSATSANRIIMLADSGDLIGNAGSGFTASTVATAPANEAFRGVALAPASAGTTASTTTLAAVATPTTYAASEILSATVTDSTTSAAVTSGWVRFMANGQEIGSAPVNASGTATFDVADNLQGPASPYVNPESIVAVFTGNSAYASSSSTPAQLVTVNKDTTTTNLTASFNPVATGVADTLTATLTVPAGTTPTGTITFWDGVIGTGINLGTVNVSQLVVSQSGTPTITFASTFAVTFATAVPHNISAVYSGDNNFATSTGTDTVVVVNASTTVVTTNNTNAASSGDSVTLTATVGGVAGVATGTVQFYDNLLPIGGPVTLAGGSGSVTVTTGLLETTSGTYSLTPGLHSITAAYVPDTASQNVYFTSTGVYEQAVQTQAFGASDTFVERVGDGITNLIATPPNPNAGSAGVGSSIYVDEYTPAGTLVQSIILPSYDGTGSQNAIHAVVADAQQSSTGQLSLSGDGQYLFLTGYDSSVDGANLGTAPELHYVNSTPRAVARIKFDGTVQTIGFTAGSSGVETGGNINGVFSPDGNKFYVSGYNGVKYFSSFTPSAALQSATATIDSAGITVTGLENDGGNLALVNSAFTNNNPVQQYTGFPTASGSAGNLPGVTGTAAAAGGQASSFTIDAYFTHLNGTGAPAGINTLYLSDDGPSFAHGSITKWALINGTWSVVDSITAGTNNTASSFYWLAGTTDSSGNVTLDTTYGNGGNSLTGPGFLYSISDSNGFDAPIGTGGAHSDTVTQVATVPTGSNETFRGAASAPQAQTTTLVDNGPNPSTTAQPITLSVTVASPGAINGPTGTLTLEDASNSNAVVPTTGNTLSSGTATLTVAAGALTAGTHNLFVVYNGDTFHQTQNSGSVSQVVIDATTTTLVDNGPNPSNSGDAVNFTATVAGGSAITGQTVLIEDADASNAVIASPTLVGGTVTFSYNGLSVGTHHLFAQYLGDSTHAGSNSSLTPVVQVVNGGGVAPAVASVVVNGGAPAYIDSNGVSVSLAGQNSVVEQILVTFNEAVTLDAGAFTITNNAAGVTVNNGPLPNTAAVTASFAAVSGSGNTQFIVTFSGPGTTAITGGTGSVIKDGLYILNTIGSHVHANSQTAADNNTGFWALYGSVVNSDNVLSGTIGDGTSEVFVDNFDYSAFKSTFGAETDIPTGVPYNVGLDGDLNGFIDNFDYSEFKGNFGADWSF